MAKNVKQSKQKKSVLNKLGGLSKRSKFIVVVLIFAVLGGGYLTYKSFAATAAPSPIRVEAANLKFFKADPGCTSNKANDPAKNNMIVLQIYCPPNKNWGVGSAIVGQNTLIRWPEGTVKYCVMAKGVGKFSMSLNNYDINSPDFKEYCTQAGREGSAGQNNGGGIAGLLMFKYYAGAMTNSPNKDSATLMTISSMTAYWYAPGTTPAPGGK